MDDEVILVLEGDLVKIMEVIYPSTYREYVSFGKNGRKPKSSFSPFRLR